MSAPAAPPKAGVTVPISNVSKVPLKRIVICCDGTWQAANHGLRVVPSNIAKIARATANGSFNGKGEYVHQVTYYHAGVGTGTDTIQNMGFLKDKVADLKKKWEGGVGAGLDENVCEAYNFIVNNFNDSDELYFFGFSRGAYTARAAAGLVANVGICSNAAMDSFFEMYQAYKTRPPGSSIRDTAWAKSPAGQAWLGACKPPTIKVVGVFDTVGSLGLPDIGLFSSETMNKEFEFHDTNLHPRIEYAFHALALDEHRRPFSPTLWKLPLDPKTKQPYPDAKTKKLIQCWFPGMHINVGGGNSDQLKAEKEGMTDLEAMANLTMAWMIARVREYTDLYIDNDQLTRVVDRYLAQVEALGEKDTPAKPANSAMGPVMDSIQNMPVIHASRTRAPGHYYSELHTEEYIHPIVSYAMALDGGKRYFSQPMNGFIRRRREHAPGYEWIKEYAGDFVEHEKTKLESALSYLHGKSVKEDGPARIVIPEFIVPKGDDAKYSERQCFNLGIVTPFLRNFNRKKGEPLSAQNEQLMIQWTVDMARYYTKLDADNGIKW